MRFLLLSLFCFGSALAQRPARIGPDGKPLLNRPVMEECEKREWYKRDKENQPRGQVFS